MVGRRQLLLQYLAAHGIGLSAYELRPGYLINSDGNLTDPTTINPRTWSCLSNAEPQPDQGAGPDAGDPLIPAVEQPAGPHP